MSGPGLAKSGEQQIAFWCARLDDPSFVYVIQGAPGTPFKIGVAKDVPARIKVLQTGNPYVLRVLYVFPGAHELETQLHKKLRDHRMQGEWFHHDAAEEFFPYAANLSERMMDAYADDGLAPRAQLLLRTQKHPRVLPGAPRHSFGGAAPMPSPVPPEVALERLKAARMRPRRPRPESTIC